MKLLEKLDTLKLDTSEGTAALNTLLCEIVATIAPKNYIVPLLRLLENNPTHHFGMPGNVVRAIEKYDGSDEDYFELLIQSVNRVPTEYNLWLMNRIMNTFEDETKIKRGITLFAKVKEETENNEIREIVQDFIENFDE